MGQPLKVARPPLQSSQPHGCALNTFIDMKHREGSQLMLAPNQVMTIVNLGLPIFLGHLHFFIFFPLHLIFDEYLIDSFPTSHHGRSPPMEAPLTWSPSRSATPSCRNEPPRQRAEGTGWMTGDVRAFNLSSLRVSAKSILDSTNLVDHPTNRK